MFQQTALPLFTDEFTWSRWRFRAWHVAGRKLVVNPLMGTQRGVVPRVLLSQVIEVMFAEDDEMIEHFLLDRPNHPLAVGVEVRAADRELDGLRSRGLEDLVELLRELGVAIVNQIPGCASDQVLHLHAGIPGLLRNPGGVRVRRAAGVQIYRLAM